MIVLKNVYKRFGDVVLFENLNLQIPGNKKILIKGINGSGKSVFLKMLVGYSKPNKGEIIIDAVVLGKTTDFMPNCGVSINAPEFIKNMTGLENLKYLASITKKVTDEEIMDWVKLFNLEYYINKKYRSYSLGMKQKMRIIQALMEKPKFLILDEPFDALDREAQNLVVKVLNDCVKNKATLIFTSHNAEYEEFADIIYELDDFKLKKVK